MITSNYLCFSVVIPVYNRGSLLLKTLKSLEGQSFSAQSYEILVMDDGSSEDIQALVKSCKSLKGPELRYYKLEHGGPGAARNRGQQLARGAVIAFCDSDVLLEKHWLSNAYHYFWKAGKRTEILALEGRTIIPDKEKITPFTHQTENESGGRYPTCNFFVERGIHTFDPRYKINFREDSDFAFSLLERGIQIHFGKDVIAYHPVLPGHWNVPYKLARRYEYDGLLYKKFPNYYREMDVHTILGIKIQQLRGKIYTAFCLACLFNIISTFFLCRILLLLSYGAVLGVYLFGQRKSSRKLYGPMHALHLSFVVPWIYLFFLLKGMGRFKA